jgi:hypothetical protein
MEALEEGAVSVPGVATPVLRVCLCVSLFVLRRTQEKDMFREHYSLLLAQRLREKKSVSNELEKFGEQQLRSSLDACVLPAPPYFKIPTPNSPCAPHASSPGLCLSNVLSFYCPACSSSLLLGSLHACQCITRHWLTLEV